MDIDFWKKTVTNHSDDGDFLTDEVFKVDNGISALQSMKKDKSNRISSDFIEETMQEYLNKKEFLKQFF